MFENYLYRPMQAFMAARWSKPRRGKLLNIFSPRGVQWMLCGDGQGRHVYRVNPYTLLKTLTPAEHTHALAVAAEEGIL